MAARAAEQALEMASPASKRRRIAVACSACRVRKSRCDGQRPSCASCLGLGFACQYESTESTNVLVRKDYLFELEQRVAANERMLQQLDHLLRGHLSDCANGEVLHPPSSAMTVRADESPHRANELEEPRDEDTSTNGMAMTFIEEPTSAFFGESSNISFAHLLLRATAAVRQPTPTVQTAADRDCVLVQSSTGRPSHLPPSPSATSSDLPKLSITTLPSTEDMDGMLDVYFDTCGVVFPCIHEGTMRKTYAECKANGFARVRRTWLGTLNMIFAMATKFDRDGDDIASAKSRLEQSNVFYKRAMELCDDLSKRVISLEIVHYLVLVVLFCQGTQRSAQAWNMHGVLVRSAVALGLQSGRSRDGLDPRTEESRRRTWLVIYCLDKLLSMVYGRPAAILDEHMAGEQTISVLHQLSPDALFDTMDLPGQFLAVSSRLYHLMSQSLVKQYGANINYENSGLDELASLQASAGFRKLLRLWASNLPSRLYLCDPRSDVLAKNTQVNRLRVILTLRYHNVSILVHRPLLTSTIRHLFRIDKSPENPSSYLIPPIMAEAHECISSAETTIEIVHGVIAADPTSRNNLGVWFFTLYYVFTASLVIIGRLLWAKHGQIAIDDAAAHQAKLLLDKAEAIFQNLNQQDPLVSSCSRYIRNLSGMCSRAGSCENPIDLPSAPTGMRPDDIPISAPNSSDTNQLDAEGLEAFGILTSEMFDPSVFDNFGLAGTGIAPDNPI
ncbi:C6 transcription factor [Corynespora cassiicola Philippines]|uniref:C6 transcription factor n=1 Tax=Corynespora cassiicola Philippines TaxID=1448308 RepID=A0A2T2P043_CORCC|nr:C6 transcription factor [Corynespora cassiicola Philippines]